MKFLTSSIDLIPPYQNVSFIIYLTVAAILHATFTIELFSQIKGIYKRNKQITNRCIRITTVIRQGSYAIEAFFVIGGIFAYIWVAVMQFLLPFPQDVLMKYDIGTTTTLEESTHFTDVYKSNVLVYNREFASQTIFPLLILALMILIVKSLSWHSGAGVVTSTLSYALADLMDTLLAVVLIIICFGGFGYGLFGAFAGSYDFHTFIVSINTITRLAFGLYDYNAYVTDEYGHSYDGIGLGSAAWWKYTTLWPLKIMH